jgi:hypothetical protein
VNQWSRVAEVAGKLEQIYQQGLDRFNGQDYESCVLFMSQVLDEVLVHSMALHYLAVSEEKLRQKRLNHATRQEAAALLTTVRTAHRQGEPKKVIETVSKLLTVDSESMEARWYRRAAETRLTTSSHTRAGSIVSPQKVRTRLQRDQQRDLKATLIVPAMISTQRRNNGVWVLGGAGLLFLALVGLFWGFMGNESKATPVSTAATGPSSLTKVRTSPFDDEEAVILYLPTANDVATSTTGPSLNSVIPRELPAGAETVVRVFGRDFSSDASVVLIRGARGIDVLSVRVLSQELLEATLRVPDDAVGRQIALTVTNSDGPRSNVLDLSVVELLTFE